MGITIFMALQQWRGYVSGWWLTYPSEKYESQMGLLFPIYGKIIQMFQTTNQIILPFPYAPRC